MVSFRDFFGTRIASKQTSRIPRRNTERVGFSLEASDDKGYSEALVAWSICAIMHYYPCYNKQEVLEFSQSQVSSLLEMISCIKNPEGLEKYKTVKFSSEFEFDQRVLGKFK